MWVHEIGLLVGLLIGAAGLLTSAVMVFVNRERRQELMKLLQDANKELRDQLADADKRIAALETQDRERERDMKALTDRVTQKAAVGELAGFIADARRESVEEHRQITEVLARISASLEALDRNNA